MPTKLVDPIPGERGAMAQANRNSDGVLLVKHYPSMDLKKIFFTTIGKNSMKTLFKSKRTRSKTPVDVVRNATSLLTYLNSPSLSSGTRHAEKLEELHMLIEEMKLILYGSGVSEPAAEACAQLTQEFFKESTLRLLILCFPNLNLEGRQDATQVIANLQKQPVNSRLIASEYLESNLDVIDLLISGYEESAVTLHYAEMLRECFRHQAVARYVLKSECMKKIFDLAQSSNFDIAAGASVVFKALMTRHKSTVAEYLSEYYCWFFNEFNSKLLESTNYITRRLSMKLLGDILLDPSNSGIMVRYVQSLDNLRITMKLLRESNKYVQIEAFHVFKLFVANQNKPPDIIHILVGNRSKILRFLSDFEIVKDESFEADKAQVVTEIMNLKPTKMLTRSGDVTENLKSEGLNKVVSCEDLQ